jgi:hypothetical protein
MCVSLRVIISTGLYIRQAPSACAAGDIEDATSQRERARPKACKAGTAAPASAPELGEIERIRGYLRTTGGLFDVAAVRERRAVN